MQGRELRRFTAQQNLAAWGWVQPILIVVDYAASLLEPLRERLLDLAQSATRPIANRSVSTGWIAGSPRVASKV